MVRRLDSRAPDFAIQFGHLLAPRGEGGDVATTVRSIIASVRARGDDALIELSQRFDAAPASLDTLKVRPEEIAAAESQCSAGALEALEAAAARIAAYHQRQIPRDELFTDADGVQLGWRWTALDSVGVYVPGGTASYPSSVLMNALPARIAGVRRIVMATPLASPLILAAAKRAGVHEVYRVGGAQAIAALAFGTARIAAVDKIVGPGNAYVAAAKREVFGQVGIDAIAGPSELCIIADGNNRPDWVAADLLSQAEHDTLSQCVLLTDDADFADAVIDAVESLLPLLPRRTITARSWCDHGAIIVTTTLAEAVELVNRLAPEHLELAVAAPEALLADVRHAGAIFLGRLTPEAMGDYIGGPNHVLPTNRTARFSSGLSVLEFLKRTSLLSFDSKSLAKLGPSAMELAKAEGLDGHACSIAARLSGLP
ncbi:MAG TPA: histidinol dehydrogenase [Rhizomicrobium sp.]|jgi:histidinol dehydrogenase